MAVEGFREIKIIQGDTYSLTVTTKTTNIKRIQFSSLGLDLCKEFEHMDNKWVLRLSSIDTQLVGYFSYDITITFDNNEIASETGIGISIVKKINPPCEVS